METSSATSCGFGAFDLEDLLAVLDRREQLASEARAAEQEARGYIAGQFKTLLATSPFLDALPGHLLPDPVSQARITVLLDPTKIIASL